MPRQELYRIRSLYWEPHMESNPDGIVRVWIARTFLGILKIKECGFGRKLQVFWEAKGNHPVFVGQNASFEQASERARRYWITLVMPCLQQVKTR